MRLIPAVLLAIAAAAGFVAGAAVASQERPIARDLVCFAEDFHLSPPDEPPSTAAECIVTGGQGQTAHVIILGGVKP